MATLTKEQFLKLNKNLLNGWRFDAYYYATWGEKKIILTNKISELKQITYKMNFSNKSRWGNELEIVINRSEWNRKKEDDMYCSHGLGKNITVCENAGTRKNYKMLEALTKDFTIEKLEQMFSDVEVETCGGMIIG